MRRKITVPGRFIIAVPSGILSGKCRKKMTELEKTTKELPLEGIIAKRMR